MVSGVMNRYPEVLTQPLFTGSAVPKNQQVDSYMTGQQVGSKADPGYYTGESNAASGGTNGYPNGYAPGQISGQQAGNYGSFYPTNLEGLYPNAASVSYQGAPNTPYNFTDPQAFAKQYADFNRTQGAKNANQSKNLSLDQLDTELKSLQGYVPGAAALQRQTTSVDNAYNQAQRTAQTDIAMPGVRQELGAQSSRASALANKQGPWAGIAASWGKKAQGVYDEAATYKSGKAADNATNAALELNVRSNAADNATAGGFGASSSVAKKASDLMSAGQRLGLAQYGDQLTQAADRTAQYGDTINQYNETLAQQGESLLGQNAQLQNNLFAAPTEYSNAGNQVKVTPSLSYSQLSSANTSRLDANTLVSPTTALQSNIQQNQFSTQMDQQMSMFNTGNAFTANQLNATAANNFAMGKFGYQVGFAGTVAGAAQTNANTDSQLFLAQKYQDIMSKQMAATQSANSIGSILNGLGSIGGAAARFFTGSSGGNSLLNSLMGSSSSGAAAGSGGSIASNADAIFGSGGSGSAAATEFAGQFNLDGISASGLGGAASVGGEAAASYFGSAADLGAGLGYTGGATSGAIADSALAGGSVEFTGTAAAEGAATTASSFGSYVIPGVGAVLGAKGVYDASQMSDKKMGIASGMMSGAAMGASIGTMIPIPGATLVGGAIGAVVGGIVGASAHESTAQREGEHVKALSEMSGGAGWQNYVGAYHSKDATEGLDPKLFGNNKYDFDAIKGSLKGQDMLNTYGMMKTFGPNFYATHTVAQQSQIAQELLNQGMFVSKQGDIKITDEDKAREIAAKYGS